MAVQTRPYFLIFNNQERMIEATSPAQAVRAIVGAAVTELRPARGAEVSAWLKAGKPMEDASAKPAAIVQTDANGALSSLRVIGSNAEDGSAFRIDTGGVKADELYIPSLQAQSIVEQIDENTQGIVDAAIRQDDLQEQLDKAPAYTNVDVIRWVQDKLGIKEGALLSQEESDGLSLVSLSAIAGELTLEAFDTLRGMDDFRFLREAIVLYSPLGAGSIDSVRTYLGDQPMKWGLIEQACAKYDQDDTHWSDREKRAQHAAEVQGTTETVVQDDDAQPRQTEQPVKSKSKPIK